jgi:type I restriction enzyme S subunit
MNQQNGNHIGLIRGAEIPSRWEKLLNFVLFAERKDQNQDDLPLLSVTIERGVLLQAELEDRKDISNPNKSKYKRVAPGDIVYNPMRMWQGAVGMSEHEGLVSPAYIVLKPIQDINPKFFHYLFRTPEYTTEAYRNSYGIVDDQHSLRYADFRRMESIVPPREEQDEIVEYLDQKTDHIDEYIVKKRELIDLLETLRRAVINRAVTQGLDDGVEMTDSGVEWLGEIPAHWEKTPLKRVSHLIQSGPFGSQLKANEYVEGQVPVINPSNLTDGRLSADQSRTVLAEKADELKRHQVEKGDILFARRGKLGACALVTNSEKGWLCGTGCARVILDKDS